MDEHESNRSKMLVVILFIILLGSPGSLLVFSMPMDVTPILLLLIIPITLAFVIWYRQILIRRDAYKHNKGFY